MAVCRASAGLPERQQTKIYKALTALVGGFSARLARDYAALPDGSVSSGARFSWMKNQLVNQRMTAEELFARGSLVAEVRRARETGGEQWREPVRAAFDRADEAFKRLLDLVE
jgi:hypothetical protein